MAPWTAEEEEALVKAVNRHKVGNWKMIKEDADFILLSHRTSKSLNDKWRSMLRANKAVADGDGDGHSFGYPIDILLSMEKSGLKDRLWDAEEGYASQEDVAELAKLAATENIVAGDFSSVTLILIKLMADKDSSVALTAIQAIGNLASRLKTKFLTSSLILLPSLLINSKVGEPAIAEALQQTLTTMFAAGSVNLTDMVEYVKKVVDDSDPLVRSSTFNWLAACLTKSTKRSTITIYRKYLTMCERCVDYDSVHDVKLAAFAALKAIVEEALKLSTESKKSYTEMKKLAEEANAAATKTLEVVNEANNFLVETDRTLEDATKMLFPGAASSGS